MLLFSAQDRGGERWWFTPGGGVHRGETVRGAAVRELFEETGFACTEAGLGPVVATSSSLWLAEEEGSCSSARTRSSSCGSPHPMIDTDGQEDLERSMITGHRWWTRRGAAGGDRARSRRSAWPT